MECPCHAQQVPGQFGNQSDLSKLVFFHRGKLWQVGSTQTCCPIEQIITELSGDGAGSLGDEEWKGVAYGL